MYEYKGWHFPNLDTHFKGYVDHWPINSYQQNVLDAALKYVKNFNLAIDIGANVGLQTVRFSEKFSQVISFEPTSLNYCCLIENTKMLKNVTINNFGLGELDKIEKISLPENSNNCGAFSIKDFVNSSLSLINEDIEIKRLDSFNYSPSLIKIDTQGYELQVLRGAAETLKSKPVLIIESETKKEKNEIFSFLTTLNYTLAESVRKDMIWISK